MGANEYNVAASWLYATLTGHTPLMALVTGVYNGNQPISGTATPPYVLFDFRGGTYTRVTDRRIMIGGLWVVRGVLRGRSFGGTLRDIAAAIDDAIEDKSGTGTGGLVYSCTAEEPYVESESEVDPPYLHLGNYYRVWAQET